MPAIRPLIPGTDANGASAFALSLSTKIDARVLAAATPEVITIPSGARIAVFTATGDFYASPTNTCAVPAADDTSGNAPMLNPYVIRLDDITQLSLAGAAGVVVTIAFYL